MPSRKLNIIDPESEKNQKHSNKIRGAVGKNIYISCAEKLVKDDRLMSEKRLYVVDERVVETAVVKVGWVDLVPFVKEIAGENAEEILAEFEAAEELGDLDGWLESWMEEHQEKVAIYVEDNQVLYLQPFETWHSGDPINADGERSWYGDLETTIASINWRDFDYGDYKGSWVSLNDYRLQNKEETEGLNRWELGRQWLERGMEGSWSPRVDLQYADPEKIIPPTGYKLVKEE